MSYARMLLGCALALLFLVGVAGSAPGSGLEAKSGAELAQIAYGGQLYDRWYRALDVDPPEKTHPAYVESQGKREGSGTWRCKECHGWDYRGKDGAYAKGSHFSGIAGIRGSDGAPVADIVAALKGDTHDIAQRMRPSALRAVAAFVAHGQLDMDRVIDRASKRAKGDANRGGRIFLTVCAKCHGADGKLIDFGGVGDSEYIGTVASKNPWEALHKIRMGQPDEDMPAMLAFPLQMQVDVLAFAQTLPAE